MSLFGGVVSVTGIGFLMLCVLAVAAVGYALGRITIKGVSLGTAGVFIVALVFGALFYKYIDVQLLSKVTVERLVDVTVNETVVSTGSIFLSRS